MMLRSTRRGFLSGLIGVVAAPAVVKATSLMPIFVPKPSLRWASTDAMPAGWVQCDGGLLRRLDYQEMFNVMGNQFGGDGVLTFALPDWRGRTSPSSGLVMAVNSRQDNGFMPGNVRCFRGPSKPTSKDTKVHASFYSGYEKWPPSEWNGARVTAVKI